MTSDPYLRDALILVELPCDSQHAHRHGPRILDHSYSKEDAGHSIDLIPASGHGPKSDGVSTFLYARELADAIDPGQSAANSTI